MWNKFDKYIVGFLKCIACTYKAYINSRFYKFIFKNRRILGPLFGCAFIAFLYFSPYHVSAVMHRSVKYSIVVWEKAEDAWKYSTYIMAHWQGEDPNNQGLEDGMVLTKRVGCKEGQVLETHGYRVFCDGIFLGTALKFTNAANIKIEQFIFNGEIPKGKLFLIGDNSYSYDSRYFGLINTSQVFGKVLFGI